MKFKDGDRVYHKTINANGLIFRIDETKERDFYQVVFFWAKYCDVAHGQFRGFNSTYHKWQWCSEDELILCYETDWVREPPNKISMIGGRSLDRLVREVCEIPRRRPGDGSDIVINYGIPYHSVPNNIRMINRNLVCNKYEQMQILGDVLCPESWRPIGNEDSSENLVVKPDYSMGGKGIYCYDGEELHSGEYFQRRFNKVREFRTHCFTWLRNNPVPLIQEKIIDDKDQLCWNKKQGGRFRTVYQNKIPSRYEDTLTEENKQTLIDMSVKALDLLGYNFGGIDFGMDAEGNFKIFEVNSRMGLRERSLYTYKRAFRELCFINL